MRIAVGSPTQETNSFVPHRTTAASFAATCIHRGGGVLTGFGAARVCGKAMLRSDLRDPDRRVPRGGFSSLGRILADQLKGGDAETCERGIEERYRTALH